MNDSYRAEDVVRALEQVCPKIGYPDMSIKRYKGAMVFTPRVLNGICLQLSELCLVHG